MFFKKGPNKGFFFLCEDVMKVNKSSSFNYKSNWCWACKKTSQDCEKLPWTHHTDVEVSSWLFLLKDVTLATTVTITTITIWVFEYCHNLSFWILLKFVFFSFLTNFDKTQKLKLNFWVLSQFEFLSFVTIWFFLVLSQFVFF